MSLYLGLCCLFSVVKAPWVLGDRQELDQDISALILMQGTVLRQIE